METKHYLALMVLAALGSGSMLACTFSQRLRDLAFFGMIAGVVFAERFDVNFLGQYWYRGTARGINISLIDILAWGVLVGSLLIPRYPRRKWFWPASAGVILLYFAYCVYSTLHAPQPLFAVWELVNIPRALVILLAAAAFVRTRRELGILVLGLTAAVCVQAVYALKQRYIGGMYRPPGTLDHANSLSMFMCTVGPVLLAAVLADWSKWIRWIAAGGCAVASVCVLLTISRAGLPIFAFVMGCTAVACTTWRITARKVGIVAAICVAMTLLLFKSWDMIVARYASATFAEEVLEIDGENRGIYWRWAGMMVQDDFTGVGLNNWSYAVSKTYGARVGFGYEDYDDIKKAPEKADIPSIRYAPPAHALAALTLGELGIPGTLLFGLVWLRWFWVGAMFLWRRLNADPMHRFGIGCLFGTTGIFLQSVTEWTYRQPALLLVFHALMGVLASLHYARRQAAKAPPPEPAETVELEQETVETETLVPARFNHARRTPAT